MEIQTYDGLNTPPFEYITQKRREAQLSGAKGKVFDWNKAATIIKENRPDVATAGLAEDWFWTGCEVYNSDDGIVSIEDGHLCSIWATPILLLEFENRGDMTEECWCYEDEHPDWDAKTRWPEEALNKFNDIEGELDD